MYRRRARRHPEGPMSWQGVHTGTLGRRITDHPLVSALDLQHINLQLASPGKPACRIGSDESYLAIAESLLKPYTRLLQCVLHNPRYDRRTTGGVFHIISQGASRFRMASARMFTGCRQAAALPRTWWNLCRGCKRLLHSPPAPAGGAFFRRDCARRQMQSCAIPALTD